MDKKKSRVSWYEKSVLNIHFDYHPTEKDINFGLQLTEQHLIEQLGKYKPTMVQFPAKGGPGYATYPTKVGIPIPGLKKDCLRIWRDATKKIGIKFIVYYNALDWVQEKLHPEWVRIVNNNGELATVLNSDGTRKMPVVVFCFNSPYQDRIMIPMIKEILEQYEPDGFWFDAENYAVFPCYCHKCSNLFNETYNLSPPPTDFNHPDWSKWTEFHRNLFVNYMKKNADFIHSTKPDCAYVSNYAYSISQPEMPPGFIDWLSGDIIQWGMPSLTARICDGKDKPFDVMTSCFADAKPFIEAPKARYYKSVTQMLQDGMSALSNGGKWIIWDNPTGEGNLHPGTQDRMVELSDFVMRRKKWFLNTQSIPWIAVLYSVENHYKMDKMEKENVVYIYHPYKDDFRALRGLHKIFLEGHKHFDILNEDTLDRLNLYSVLVLPNQKYLNPNIITNIKNFVKNGGSIMAVGMLPKDLWEAFGINSIKELSTTGLFNTYTSPPFVVSFPIFKINTFKPVERKYEIVNGKNELCYEKIGNPAVIINNYFKGKAAYFTYDLFGEYQEYDYYEVRNLVLETFEKIDKKKLLRTDAPASVEFSLRQKDNVHIIHLTNLSTQKNFYGNSVLVDEVPIIPKIEVRYYYEKKPRAVIVQPENKHIDYIYKDKYIKFIIDKLHIHKIVEIQY